MRTTDLQNPCKRRPAIALSRALEKKLSAYAIAGTVALGALPHMQGAVVYTLVHAFGSLGQATAIDLNGDGVQDFDVLTRLIVSTFPITEQALQVSAATPNGIAIASDGYPAALKFKDAIGPDLKFGLQRLGLVMYGRTSSIDGHVSARGNFNGVKNSFLGLKFVLNGEIYYGWARFDTRGRFGQAISYELVDFAYENTPNQPIKAGAGIPLQQQAGLGVLALGSDGLALWRGNPTQ